MITDDQIKDMFPAGKALLIPGSGAPSTVVQVNFDALNQEDDNVEEYFLVWVSPYKELRVARNGVVRDGGLAANSGIGPVFLRPHGGDNA